MSGLLKKYSNHLLLALLFCAVVYPPVFLHLENLAVRRHDEARLAANAYAMSKDSDYIVTHFEHEVEMWNTKPPLFIWAQVFFIKIFGYNELSIRLPSALAALFTCLALLIFSARFLKSQVLGILAVGILVTSSGYIGIHLSRTGDYDSMLTLFTTTTVLCFFIACETNDKKKRNRFLGFFFLLLALAVLTKSVAGLLFTPALLIYALIRKKLLLFLKNKFTWLYFSVSLLTVSSYYVTREIFNPGYLQMVIQNELGGRYLEVIEGHREGPMFYFDFIVDVGYKHWFLFAVAGIALWLFSKNEILKHFSLLLMLCVVSFILIISNSETKIFWYAMPVFPFLACSSALFFSWLFEVLKNIAHLFPAAKKNRLLTLWFYSFYGHPTTIFSMMCITPVKEDGTQNHTASAII